MASNDQKNLEVQASLHNLNAKLWDLKFPESRNESLKKLTLEFADKCGALFIETLKESNAALLKAGKTSQIQNCVLFQDVTEFKPSLMLVAGPYPTKDSFQMTVASVGLISIPSFVDAVKAHQAEWKKVRQVIIIPDPGWLLHWELSEVTNQMLILIQTLNQLADNAQFYICELPGIGSTEYVEKVKMFNSVLVTYKSVASVTICDVKNYLPNDHENNGSPYLKNEHAEHLIRQLVDTFNGNVAS
ncbi:unnamed protein product [Bursaphelenchus okinawaensis]|uniref:Uncharacterized protein n=1 Tax=Bursaphelenchus okinawaensis TaxID=465554 RepID=A0A811KXY3_9BILA|nr:unnamed protein product [Bursaphelenchus okinawaensis]CAG9113655.1 unnamed protein product [Bursaphelenchus okinawaensis]